MDPGQIWELKIVPGKYTVKQLPFISIEELYKDTHGYQVLRLKLSHRNFTS